MVEDITDVTMMQDLMNKQQGISAVEKLLNEFEAHEDREEKALDEYRQSLGVLKDPATRFIMQMIISDEEKHRAVTHAIAATLKGSLNWTRPTGSLEGAPDEGDTTKKLAAVTDEFIKLEKEGIKEYKVLLKESAGYYHGLFKLLIESMIRDSEKHVEMLQFLGQRLKAA